MNMRRKTKSVYAYLDGKLLCDVTKTALDNNMMLNDMKKLIELKNPGHEVTFKVKQRGGYLKSQ